MSYDLVFWQQASSETRPPQEIFAALAAGQETIEGLATLPIESFLATCLQAFPAAKREPNGNVEWIVIDQPGQTWSAQVEWSPIHIWVTLRGKWPGDVANQFIDLGSTIDCPLFDPQTSERFS